MIGVLVFVLVFAAVLIVLLPARVRLHHRPPGAAGPSGAQPRVTGPRTADPRAGPPDAALALDLLAAAALSGQPLPAGLVSTGQACGGPLGQALERMGAALLLGADIDQAWAPAQNPALDRAVRLVRDQAGLMLVSGAPGSAILHAAADGVRRRRRRAREVAAARLGVRLVLPTGLCALPAFVCLGVVPVVLSLLADLGW